MSGTGYGVAWVLIGKTVSRRWFGNFVSVLSELSGVLCSCGTYIFLTTWISVDWACVVLFPQNACGSWGTAMGSLSCHWLELPWQSLLLICCCTLFRSSRVEAVLYKFRGRKWGQISRRGFCLVVHSPRWEHCRAALRRDCVSFSRVTCFGHQSKWAQEWCRDVFKSSYTSCVLKTFCSCSVQHLQGLNLCLQRLW